jgi:hypothetical protein
MPTVEYLTPGATEYKYLHEPVATVKPDPAAWKILKTEVDWEISKTWSPDPFEPPYIYVFGNPWYAAEEMPTAEYHVPGATEHKYCNDPVLTVKQLAGEWKILKTEAKWNIDKTWAPNPFEPPYIYVFGNPWYSSVEMPTVEYHVPGATEYKYCDDKIVTIDTDHSLWTNLRPDIEWDIDYTWMPDPFEPPYIYVFGSIWYGPEKMPVLEYRTPGATERKYIDTVRLSPSTNGKTSRWKILKSEVEWVVNTKWAPNPFEPPYIYVFGNPWYSAVEMPTAEYHVPGATEYKYCDDQVLTVRSYNNWKILKPEAKWEIDKSWAPNPFEPPYIYVFGNPWYTSVEMPTVEYIVVGATERKYVDDQIVTIKPSSTSWKILKEGNWEIDKTWMPNPFEPPYIYVFGNPWYTAEEMPTAEYHVHGAIERKYVDDKVLSVKTEPNRWAFLRSEAKWNVDPTWCPNPFEPPYIYVFGNPWYTAEEMPTAEYNVHGATERKYVDGVRVTVAPNTIRENWKLLRSESEWDIDLTWMPNPFEPPYIYVFGNPWYTAEEMPTAEYYVPGATEKKYCDNKIITVKLTQRHWKALVDNVDISSISKWTPNPFEPAYIYVFGNQWYGAADMPTVEYHVPGATERKYITDEIATLTPTRTNWFVPEEINAGMIDFSWLPHPKEQPYVYHFSSEFQMSTGMTYTVPGATELKFETDVPVLKRRIGARLNSFNKEVVDNKAIIQTVSMFFVDMNNKSSARRFEVLKMRYPDIQKIRYMNGWVETIKRCLTRSETQKFWVISSENVYDDFNFEWHAQPWQNYMTHVFASQWQKWSDTFLINKREFERHIKWAKTLEEFPNLNFVSDQPVYRPDDIYDIYYVDHFNPGSQANLERIQKRYPTIKSARYVDNYLDTFKRIVSTAKTDYIWVTNSICDYSKFDFTWQPEPWQKEMLHVFPSDTQKFGDTFYLHVPSFKAQMDKLELLDWFTTVNYCADQNVPRLPIDIVTYDCDSVVDAIKEHEFKSNYAIFKHTSTLGNIPKFSPSIWRKKDRVVHVFAQNGSIIAAPREVKTMLDTQVYDYPYIMPHKDLYIKSKDLDIVYLSNGEPDAQKWYDHLVASAPNQKVHWVKDVKGRAEAYKACALASTTPWYFNVFAKFEVSPTFDWTWQPDYMQEPKHYMFNAKNPVNGLEYGHMAVLAYNKKLVLNTEQHGLDFTLSAAHESVDMMSGIARYNVNPIVTWRTAFRECIKLRNANDGDSYNRLQTWLTVAEGDNAEWSINGAKDAVEYYESVNGDMNKLLQSFEWEWLDAYYASKYQR